MPEIKMPKLSDTMTEGTLVRWKKKKGDKVSSGEIIAEIETDKATMEWESTDDGVLSELYVQEGGKVAVGQRVALLLAPGEKASTASNESASKQSGTKKSEGVKASSETGSAKSTGTIEAAAGSQTKSEGSSRVKASPLAKKIAAAEGIELANVTGTGPGSRIVQKDLQNSQSAGAKAEGATMGSFGSQQRVPHSGMRRVIAERLLASKTQIPHFYLNIEVDAGELMRLRTEFNKVNETGDQAKLTVNDFILKAAVTAVTRVPKVNATFDKDAIIEYNSVNLAVAVAVEDGLVTPVIRDAQKMNLRQISDSVKDMASRARNKKLKPEEYQGGTFTVSNLGSYGIESFAAIINPPQAVILSIGAIVKKPVVNQKNEIVVGMRMAIGMSCDHRVVDGAIGAQYLNELRALLENPMLMLI